MRQTALVLWLVGAVLVAGAACVVLLARGVIG